MKLFKNLLILLMVLVTLTALVACGGNDNAENGDNGSGTTVTATVDQDKKVFRDRDISAYEIPIASGSIDTLGTTEDALQTILSAYKYDSENPENSVVVLIYYFKTETAAKACYENVKSYDGYKLIGTKLVYGDNTNLITK